MPLRFARAFARVISFPILLPSPGWKPCPGNASGTGGEIRRSCDIPLEKGCLSTVGGGYVGFNSPECSAKGRETETNLHDAAVTLCLIQAGNRSLPSRGAIQPQFVANNDSRGLEEEWRNIAEVTPVHPPLNQVVAPPQVRNACRQGESPYWCRRWMSHILIDAPAELPKIGRCCACGRTRREDSQDSCEEDQIPYGSHFGRPPFRYLNRCRKRNRGPTVPNRRQSLSLLSGTPGKDPACRSPMDGDTIGRAAHGILGWARLLLGLFTVRQITGYLSPGCESTRNPFNAAYIHRAVTEAIRPMPSYRLATPICPPRGGT